MWNTIVEQLNQTLHFQFKIKQKRQLASSSANKLFYISDEQRHFFVKVAPLSAFERLEAQANDLSLLTTQSLFLVPVPLVVGKTLEFSYVVLEWLDMSEPENQDWQLMGQYLASLHKKHDQAMFGAEQDNYLCLTAQPNRWHKKWDVFFAEERIGWQLQLLAEKGFALCDIDQFVEQIKQHLHSHHVQPALLHGNFWRGNVGAVNNVPCLFDPACYYGDREVDIATSRLFAKLPDAFYIGYQQHYPLPKDAPQRERIYNLYHVLNHANVYSGNYLAQARELIFSIQHG